MEPGFLKIPWVVWGGLSLVVALIFAFVVPGAAKVNAASGLQFFIARWFHSLVWVFLAASFFLRAARSPEAVALANPTAALGGITYLIFLFVFTQLK